MLTHAQTTTNARRQLTAVTDMRLVTTPEARTSATATTALPAVVSAAKVSAVHTFHFVVCIVAL